jgi:hypothetical protein
MWSQCNTVVTRAGSHRDQVGFQHVAVDHQAWSLKVRNQRCQGHHDIVPDLEPASSTVREPYLRNSRRDVRAVCRPDQASVKDQVPSTKRRVTIWTRCGHIHT